MGKRRFFLLIITVLTGFLAIGQDTLPNFSATTRGNNRVVISWTNNYKFVSQISIQRSTDSTKNFKTILTVPDPTVPQNGFVDSKAPANNLFYRIFIVLDSGRYIFSKSKRAFWDTAILKKPVEDLNQMPVNGSKQVIVSKELNHTEARELKEKIIEATRPEAESSVVAPEKFFVVMKKNSLVGSINQKHYKQFRDSVVTKTKDTILFKTVDTIQINPFVPKVVYKPSKYIYTEKDGNVAIVLPDAGEKKYLVRFYEDNMDFLFEVKKLKENFMYLDKANFQHSGWFRFELLEDGKLIEKHRFYIPKEF